MLPGLLSHRLVRCYSSASGASLLLGCLAPAPSSPLSFGEAVGWALWLHPALLLLSCLCSGAFFFSLVGSSPLSALSPLPGVLWHSPFTLV